MLPSSSELGSKLILASQSPRRQQLLVDAGYQVHVIAPNDSVEMGVDSTQGVQSIVVEASFLKARHVAASIESGLILAADTVAECGGRVLGKPADRQHAEQMLRWMRGKTHSVYTGVTIWDKPSDLFVSHLERTLLQMDVLTDGQLAAYLDGGQWEGKAGAFGYQEGLDWVHVISGLASNVVGLPVERLPAWFEELAEMVAEGN